MIQERNIALCIILSIVTCGIYSLYWMICMNDDIDTVSENPTKRNGVLVIVLSLVTCSIYQMYWWYQNGQLLEGAAQKKGVQITSSAVICLILAIFGLSIVDYIIVQLDLNKFAAKNA